MFCESGIKREGWGRESKIMNTRETLSEDLLAQVFSNGVLSFFQCSDL